MHHPYNVAPYNVAPYNVANLTFSKVGHANKRADSQRHNAAVICLANRKTRALFHTLANEEPYLTPAERKPTAGHRESSPRSLTNS